MHSKSYSAVFMRGYLLVDYWIAITLHPTTFSYPSESRKKNFYAYDKIFIRICNCWFFLPLFNFFLSVYFQLLLKPGVSTFFLFHQNIFYTLEKKQFSSFILWSDIWQHFKILQWNSLDFIWLNCSKLVFRRNSLITFIRETIERRDPVTHLVLQCEVGSVSRTCTSGGCWRTVGWVPGACN